ncbi:hypothetical protein C2S51_014691 [Perilla frutescens var. frutescens]|nr:hypothetical protein C2S51_014691 [Perilla frutescens var. frutescens]
MQFKKTLELVVCMAAIATLFSAESEATISCGQLQGNLTSCLGFLRGGALTQPCCTGVKSVAASARTVADRRDACRCLVAVAKSLRGTIDFGKAARLPGRCGVSIPFQISPNTNCARFG